MEPQKKEDVGERRMLLPELSSAVGSLHNFSPISFEVLSSSHERHPGAISEEKQPQLPTVSRGEATKDVGAFLAPDAIAALKAVLSGRGHYDTPTLTPTPTPTPPRTEVALPTQLRADTRVPVLKTSAGSFIVTPTPPVSLSFPTQRPFPQRPLANPTPSGVGLPSEHILFATPDRRIKVQNNPTRPTPSPPPVKSTVGTYLVQAPGGQYCIMSGAEAPRSAEGRMLPIDLKPHAVSLTQPNAAVESKTMTPPPNLVPSHPTMFLKPMKTTVSLAPKLQSPPNTRLSQPPQLSQKLLERPGNTRLSTEPMLSSESFAAQAENLKNLFLSGGNHLPVTPLEKMSFTSLPSSEFTAERSDVSHKRRKTSTPASLDNIPYPLSAAQQAGLELLLQAVKTMGDPLPLDTDLHNRRALRNRRSFDDRPYSSRLSNCLDRTLHQGLGVLDTFTGVYPLMDGTFVARCRYKGCYVLIGSFQTAEDAARAYDRVVLSNRGRKARTNYPYSEYLNFELQNAKRAFEAKYKQCERTRRGSAWPWARAAQTLLANPEEGSEERRVPELGQTVGPLREAVPGASVFELLQNVMLKKKDLNGTFDLIQTKIRQLQARIQSGLSTEEECDCVGQYACVASILGNLVSMQNEWERKHDEGRGGSRGDRLDGERSHLLLSDQGTSESKQVTSSLAEGLLRYGGSVSEGGDQPYSELSSSHCAVSREPGLQGDGQQSNCDDDTPQNLNAYGLYAESIRWVRLLASSLWPRKRGGGMLWKAYQPLFKSNHHRHSILELREKLYVKSDCLEDDFHP